MPLNGGGNSPDADHLNFLGLEYFLLQQYIVPTFHFILSNFKTSQWLNATRMGATAILLLSIMSQI